VSSSMKWEMWTSQIWWRQRIQRIKMFRAFVRTLMAPEKAPVFELIVSQQMANIWSTTS
jgi:hypothetical protein